MASRDSGLSPEFRAVSSKFINRVDALWWTLESGRCRLHLLLFKPFVGRARNTYATGTNRVPDGKTDSGQYVEVKSGDVTGTKQLNEMAAGAWATIGQKLLVVTDTGSKVSKPVQQNPNIEIQKHPIKQ